jgi:predicted AlkP superfamily pyrophosphatase or phosphodiesterase
MSDATFLTFDLTQPLHQVLFIIWIIGCWEFGRAYIQWVRTLWGLA